MSFLFTSMTVGTTCISHISHNQGINIHNHIYDHIIYFNHSTTSSIQCLSQGLQPKYLLPHYILDTRNRDHTLADFPSSTGALPNHLSTSPLGLNTSKNIFLPPKIPFHAFQGLNQAPIFTYTQPKPHLSYPYTTSQYPNIIEQQIILGLRILPHPRSKETRLTFSFKRVGSYNIKEPKISTFLLIKLEIKAGISKSKTQLTSRLIVWVLQSSPR